MSYLLNYKKWRAVHEAAIFEASETRYPTSDFALGKEKISDFYAVEEDKYAVNTFLTTHKANDNVLAITKELSRILNSNSTGDLIMDYSGKQPTPVVGAANKPASSLFQVLLDAATGQFTEKEMERLKPEHISFTKRDDLIKFTPAPNSQYNVATIGTVYNASSGTVTYREPGVETSTEFSELISALNYHNIAAKALGAAHGQYDGTEFTNGYFDVTATNTTATVNDTLIFFVPQVAATGSVERTETAVTKVVAGVSADKTQADVGFAALSSTLTSDGKTKVAELAKTILEKFKGQTVTGFNLISSASPEYGKILNATGWEKNYDVTTGTTDPGVGTTDAAKNKKLAYDRGVSFMTELNSQLATQGHPGFSDYTITWQIASTGGPTNNGRFVDLNLATNEQKPKIEVTGTKVGGTSTAGAISGGADSFSTNVYLFKVSRTDKKGEVIK